MSATARSYKNELIRRLTELDDGQEDAIHEAALIMADTIERGGIIRAFGSGHSYASALEISGRAGGYIQTRVINEPARGIYERVEGVGELFWNSLDVREEDCLVIISNSGRNPLPLELAFHAREAGIKVIAVTALAASQAGTSRHSSGKLLYEVADVVLDNKSAFGDTCIEVEGLPCKVGGTSLYTSSLLLDYAVMDSMDILLERGVVPPVFMSANVDDGPEFNQRLLDQFKHRLAEF